MKKIKFNEHWKVSKVSETPLMAAVSQNEVVEEFITLPHDGMIFEKRTRDTKNKHQTGFYPGNLYTYTKQFVVPEDWRNKKITFEFEGVYQHSKVYINGDYAGGCANGYTNFYVAADDFIKYGERNEIRVVADNSDEENSRWYSGSGIYRDVYLYIGNPVHFEIDNIRLSTPEVDREVATVQVDTRIANQGFEKKEVQLITKIFDDKQHLVTQDCRKITLFGQQTEQVRQRIFVSQPRLWNVDTPYLYTCQLTIQEEETILDESTEMFGIRELTLDATRGLRINGQEVKLRGACIHHDNGIIGAATFERAEERRCQQLKEAGFNAIRSSHHPISKAMLKACDRNGMLVIDELADSWTRPKNNHDYSREFIDHWEYDLTQMIAKDFNHPSVIMYIAGNEIQEAGTAKGAQLNRIITDKIHELDDTRYVSSAINGLLASMEKMGELMSAITGMSMEELAQAQQDVLSEEDSDAGSDEVNGMANVLKGPLADAMATNPIMNTLLAEFADGVDVVGYNYLTARHSIEKELNPNRIVLGTETFPADIYRLWQIVKENTNVLGDMTWTGYDYLGEAGAGVFYYDGRQGFMENWPISVAYLGDIDLIGNRRTISYYREIVYGLRKEPYIAVERLNHYGQAPSTSAWIWKDELSSWTWSGYEGKPAVVNVYSMYSEIELFLNGISLGRRTLTDADEYCGRFEIDYQPGVLEAINYQDGEIVGRHQLRTAEPTVTIHAEVDRPVIAAGADDLAYINLTLMDPRGNENLQEQREVIIAVDGPGEVIGFGSANPATDNYYQNDQWKTFDGKLLAVIQSKSEPGEVTVSFRFSDQDDWETTCQIQTVLNTDDKQRLE